MPFDSQPVTFDDMRAAFDAAKKAADRQTIARDAYAHAAGLGEAFDASRWPCVAQMLFEALPKARRGVVADDEPEPSRFAPWFSNPPARLRTGKPKDWKSVRCVVTFEGGREVRASALILPGKPLDVGVAARAACELYRAKGHAWGEVPPIIGLREIESGAEYDPADACRETVETRRAIDRPQPGHSPEWQRRRAEYRLRDVLYPENVSPPPCQGFERAKMLELYARLFRAERMAATPEPELVQPASEVVEEIDTAPKTAADYVGSYVAPAPRRSVLAAALMRSAAIPARIAA